MAEGKPGKNQEIRALTGIRGLAALFVVLYHLKLYELMRGPAATFMTHGYLSVDLFFALSGFVMAMTYKHLFASGFRLRSYLLFLGRRIARIYPLYLLVTCFFMAILVFNWAHPPKPETVSPFSAIANILMVQGWGLARSYLGPGWSISTEWAVYLLFPLLTALTLFSRRSVAIATGLLSALLLILASELPGEMTGILKTRGPLDIAITTNYGPLVRCVLEFTLGLLAYRFSQSAPGAALRARGWISTLLALGILAALAVPGSDVVPVLLMPLFIITLADDRSVPARLLGTRPLHWLGVLSYSLYLDHFVTTFLHRRFLPVFTRVVPAHAEFLTIMAQTVCALLLAVVTYQLIEKPGRLLLRHIFEPKAKIAPDPRPDLAAP